jgi:hypothetical protein
MRRILLLIFWQFGLLAGIRLFADVVTLKDGRQISGLVESGNTQELHIKVGDQSQTLDIHQVQAIWFGGSSGAPAITPPANPKAAPEPAPAQPNSLVLKDGTHIAGRWWSLDATDMHFLVNHQLQHYPRPGVSGVTFGNATLPVPPARSPPPPAISPQPPAIAAQPARAPTLARSSDSAPPQPPPSARPAGAPPPVPSGGLSQPEEIGAVYFSNGRDLTALERNQAVEHGSGASQYFEMPAPQSRVRLKEASSLVFVVRLPKGVEPGSYSLFPLVTVKGTRRTRPQPGRRGGLVTWPVDIEKTEESSSYIAYSFTVRDLPTGEYSFSPSTSNDGYCFGVDPSASGK